MRTVVLAALTLAGGVLAADEPASPAGLLQAPEPLAAALHARFGKDLHVRRVTVQAEGAEIEVQDAQTPGNLNRYPFADGALGTPEPIHAGRNLRRLRATLFRFAEVDLSILPRLLADALRRAATPDARVTQALIERSQGYGDSETWGRPLIRVHVDGPRGGALVEYGLDGRHKHTNRW
jgi:hypothetical protein